MAVAANLEQYKQIQKNRIAKLKKLSRRGPITAAKYMVAQLRSMAPRKTGHLINSIKRRKNEVEARGSDRVTGWPYIHWINDTPGINLTSWGKKYSSGKVKKTGTPGFYLIAQRRTQEFNRKAMIRATRVALKSEF